MLCDVIYFNTLHSTLFIHQIVLIYFSIRNLITHLMIWINTRRNKYIVAYTLDTCASIWHLHNLQQHKITLAKFHPHKKCVGHCWTTLKICWTLLLTALYASDKRITTHCSKQRGVGAIAIIKLSSRTHKHAELIGLLFFFLSAIRPSAYFLPIRVITIIVNAKRHRGWSLVSASVPKSSSIIFNRFFNTSLRHSSTHRMVIRTIERNIVCV